MAIELIVFIVSFDMAMKGMGIITIGINVNRMLEFVTALEYIDK